MPKERIAIFARFLEDAGGLERAVVNFSRGSADLGYDIDLILFTAEGPFVEMIPDNVNVVDFKNPRILMSITKLIRYLRQTKPDVIFCFNSDRGFAAVIANIIALTRIPVMIVIQNVESLERPANQSKKVGLLLKLKRNFCPLASKIILASHGLVDSTVEELHISREKIHVIYNPVVTEKLKQDMHQSISHQWLQEKSIPVILAAGRLEAQKDYVTLLHAFKYVVSQMETRLIIIGEGRQRQMLTNLVHELDLQDWVDMPGFVDNPYKYMKNADLFVLSSKFEGFGNVVAEAIACGCPVVSTNCISGPSEILQDGEYGTLVPIEDPEALGQAIIDALQQEHDIEKLQRRAEDFSENTIVNEYIKLFEA